jgi:hypothetical protein
MERNLNGWVIYPAQQISFRIACENCPAFLKLPNHETGGCSSNVCQCFLPNEITKPMPADCVPAIIIPVADDIPLLA